MPIPQPDLEVNHAAPPRRLTAALVGNPNTGKTTLFNALSGLRQRTGNYPGVTVETKRGLATCAGQPVDIIDLPGTYSLAARSPDEMVAVDVILGRQAGETRPDVVVSIVDASNLDRNLYLTTQVLELGVPVIIALNMVDVATGQGLHVDAEQLSKLLELPVVPIQANQGKGLDRLREVIAASVNSEAANQGEGSPFVATGGPPVDGPSTGGPPVATSCVGEGAVPTRPVFPEAFEAEVAALQRTLGDVPTFLARRLLLDVGGFTEQRLVAQGGPDVARQVQEARARLATVGCAVPGVEARTRYSWIRQVSALCVRRPAVRVVNWTDRLDRVLTHRVWGTLIFLAVMFVVFQSIFTAAQPLMDLISNGKDWVAGALRDRLPAGMFTSLLLDGVLAGVGSVLVFIPQIAILFGFLAVLEDCGYMARAAFLMDRLMARCGLSGKSFIPMLSSVACAVPGILATRVIENRRDRLATILVAPLMSCSARLPVYILLIGAFLTDGYPWWLPGLVMFSLYLLGLVLAPIVALLLKRTLLRGATPLFVMEMPLYKRPSLWTVLLRMSDATGAFLKRAGTLILASMVLVWALLYFPRGDLPTALRAEAETVRQEANADGVKDEDKEAQTEEAKRLEADAVQVEHDGLNFDTYLEAQRRQLEGLDEEARKARKARLNSLYGAWTRQSLLGQMGKAVEPAVRPLGWDWRVGMAAIASFPAREVVVGTLGIIYNEGKVDSDEITDSKEKVRANTRWQGWAGRRMGRSARPQGVHGGHSPVVDGLLCPVLPVCLDAGGDPPRDAFLALAGVHVRLHDWPGLHRGPDRLPGGESVFF